MIEGQLLTPDDVALQIGKSRKDVMRLDDLRYYLLGKRLRRYEPKDVADWLRRHPRPLPEPMENAAIVSSATQRIIGPTVYFLILRGEIVYVGKTKNLLVRLGQHADNKVEFDAYAFIQCKPEELDRMEDSYIYRIQPRFNKVGIYTRSAEPVDV